MRELYGKGISDGAAFAVLRFYRRNEASSESKAFAGEEAEWSAYLSAREETVAELTALAEKARESAGDEAALLFETHAMMAEDLDWEDGVSARIRSERETAAQAVRESADELAAFLAASEDEYMRARCADVSDVAARLISRLLGGGESQFHLTEPTVLAADDLLPSETVQLDKEYLKGIILFEGSANGHTAILARSLGIPAVIRADAEVLADAEGENVFLDGRSGRILISPEGREEALCRECILHIKEEETELLQYRERDTRSRSGQMVRLFCNIGSCEEADDVLHFGGEGVGLFRSEFLFLRRDTYPTEEEQFDAYKTVLEKLPGREVIIRTCDIGSDKRIGYFELPEEENPALGTRAVRLCLARPDFFKTQLRALYRASAFGKLFVLIPMIASLWEFRACKELIETVKNELRAEGIAFDDSVPIGVMIETPAAALISNELAREADFFSIGTNDLTQYTLACDRNGELGRHFDAHHPAVLRLIEMTVRNAHAAGIRATVCGELGADESLSEWFLSIGVDELSVAPRLVPTLRKHISEIG